MKKIIILNKAILLCCAVFVSACSSEDNPLSIHIHLEKAKKEQAIEVDGQLTEADESGKVAELNKAELNKEEEVSVVVKRSFPNMFGKNSAEAELEEPVLKSNKANTKGLAVETESKKEPAAKLKLKDRIVAAGVSQAASNTETEDTEPLVEVDKRASEKEVVEVAGTQEQLNLAEQSNNNSAKASVKVADKVMTSAWFEVDWRGPRNSADYLIIISTDGKSRFDQRFVGGSDKALEKMLAPEEPGEYVLNYESGGVIYASTKLTVVKAVASINLPESVLTGAHFDVEWTGPKNQYDELAIFTLDGKTELSDVYVYRKNDQSPAKLRAPEKAGEYAVHYYTRKGNTFARDTFQVTQAQASVDLPESVVTGAHFDVEWAGPKNQYDELAIFTLDGKTELNDVFVYRKNDQSPAKLRAPEKAGKYAVHYYTRKGNTFARDTFQVTQAQASVEVPESVVTGAHFDVQWAGPKNQYDEVAIFTLDGKTELNDAYVYRVSDQSPAKLRAPEKVGKYAVHYYTRKGNTFARDTFQVTQAQASLEVPESVVIGAHFDVKWTGPKNQYDELAIFTLDGKTELNDVYVYRESDQSPAKLRAPEKAGEYAVHYYTTKGNTFARKTFKVTN